MTPCGSGPIRYEVVHTTTYSYSEPVPVCHNEIHLVPRSLPHQRLRGHRLVISPAPVTLSSHVDYFGNQAGFFSIEEGHERLVVTATSRVEVDPETHGQDLSGRSWESVRDRLAADPAPDAAEARQFRFESPLVRSSPQLAEWAARSFPPSRSWAEALVDLTRRIHRDFAYDPTATTISTPVEEVFALKRGVCQDFAHLQIACLRSLGLAARYVSGYLSNQPRPSPAGTAAAADAGMIGADASHAWVSCWGGERGWIDVDPTNDCVVGGLHITLGWGRDYGDVCPIKGVYVGGGLHHMDVAVHVTPDRGDDGPSEADDHRS
jgi:transglutaminase-like putative cysteine protease